MAFFGQNHGLTPFEKNANFWSLKNSAMYSQKSSFFLFKVIKHYF